MQHAYFNRVRKQWVQETTFRSQHFSPHAGNRCLLTFAGPHHKSQSAPISFLTDIRILLPPSLSGMAAWGVRFGETQGYASAQQAVSVAALGALSRAFLYLFLSSQSHLAKSFFC